MNRLYLSIFFLLFFINSNSGTTYTCDSTSSCGCSTASTVVTARIVGGEIAPNHAWGWALSLQQYGSQRCTAVLISSEYALTAAHCVNGVSVSTLTILAGTNDLSDTSGIAQRRQILGFTMHPDYNSAQNTYDIAVLYFSPLSVPANGTVSFICLPASGVDSFTTGSNVVAVGWGVTAENSETPSNSLQQVTVQIVASTSADCLRVPIYNANVQLCAGVSGGGKGMSHFNLERKIIFIFIFFLFPRYLPR
jgi:secreted trypsin-like serine protease